jgi:hypothetical protein
MRAELPPDATDQEVTNIRAEGFRQALTHAATDAEFRLRMIMGESVRDYHDLLDKLRAKLLAEPQAVRDLAMKFAGRPDLLAKPIRDATVAHVQQVILIDATEGGTRVPHGTDDVTST